MNWVNSQTQFLPKAMSDFANGGDGWLVAFARATDSIVVTQEVLDNKIKRTVPIPNVCQAFSVQFMNTFEMLRQLQVKLT